MTTILTNSEPLTSAFIVHKPVNHIEWIKQGPCKHCQYSLYALVWMRCPHNLRYLTLDPFLMALLGCELRNRGTDGGVMSLKAGSWELKDSHYFDFMLFPTCRSRHKPLASFSSWHACCFPITMDSHPLEHKPNKPFLLQVALVMVLYHSNKKGTNTVSYFFKKRTWRKKKDGFRGKIEEGSPRMNNVL